MHLYVAQARKRRALETNCLATKAATRAALEVGGHDYDEVDPDDPQGYTEISLSNGAAWNPVYLNNAELDAWIAAWENALGGHPF